MESALPSISARLLTPQTVRRCVAARSMGLHPASAAISHLCIPVAIVTGSFGFMGKGGSVGTAIIAGATYTDAPTNDVMNAGVNFASLTMTGVTSPKITAVTLEGNNNLRLQPVVGSIDSAGVGAGRFVLNGSVTMYFEDKAAYDLFLAGTAADLTFTIGGASTKKYQFTIGKLKFSDADVSTPGNDQDSWIDRDGNEHALTLGSRCRSCPRPRDCASGNEYSSGACAHPKPNTQRRQRNLCPAEGSCIDPSGCLLPSDQWFRYR